MSASRKPRVSEELGLGDDPLAGTDVLTETFYAPAKPAPKKARASTSTASTSTKKAKASRGRRMPLKDGASFRLVTFSFYEEDVARLDALLEEARKLGKRRASRSQIVRLALRQVDVSQLPDEI